ncbi:spermidine/putrescine transport system permease protein [Bacilli bacterium PM5-3]|nr:spermidine/putrescine transport system permease protein [Bacilli bacterium PM5-3]MDH6603803.1 spermidine/putrescine transport system permease protein [Bacilli bacterium PM5-9]
MKQRSLILPVYVIWLIILVFIPFLLMLFLAFTKTKGLDLTHITFSLDNFKDILDPIYFDAYKNSIVLSTIASLLCLLIGYPVAYILTKIKSSKTRNILLAMFVLPMWSNMLLRIIGWEILFNPSSILNSIGISFDLIGSPFAIIIGMVSTYLPLMIFPIYTSLNKLDNSLIEASYDLGASKFQTFKSVILPLSLPGIYSGFTMTFLPSATNFALPERLSGGNITLLGNIINSNFGKSFNYGFGSLLSVILIVIIFIVMIFINKKDKDGDLLL